MFSMHNYAFHLIAVYVQPSDNHQWIPRSASSRSYHKKGPFGKATQVITLDVTTKVVSSSPHKKIKWGMTNGGKQQLQPKDPLFDNQSLSNLGLVLCWEGQLPKSFWYILIHLEWGLGCPSFKLSSRCTKVRGRGSSPIIVTKTIVTSQAVKMQCVCLVE